MNQRLWCLLGLFCCLVTTVACNWVYKTVSLQLPDVYQGWIWVVPVPDTLTAPVHRQGTVYLVGEEGVVYLPATLMKGVSRYHLYQHGEDLEPLNAVFRRFCRPCGQWGPPLRPILFTTAGDPKPYVCGILAGDRHWSRGAEAGKAEAAVGFGYVALLLSLGVDRRGTPPFVFRLLQLNGARSRHDPFRELKGGGGSYFYQHRSV
jgi:hypothetical protein